MRCYESQVGGRENGNGNGNGLACPTQITHTIVAGDTLYSLARRYDTTVTALLNLNPGVEVYNLRIGSGLLVCPGSAVTTPVPPIGTVPPVVVPPIGTIPPVTEPPVRPVPPIGIIPTPVVPPIGQLPSTEALRELLMFVLRWIRTNLDLSQANDLLNLICGELRQRS